MGRTLAVRPAMRPSLRPAVSSHGADGMSASVRKIWSNVWKDGKLRKLNHLLGMFFCCGCSALEWLQVLVEFEATRFGHKGTNYSYAGLISSIFYWRYDVKGLPLTITASTSSRTSLWVQFFSNSLKQCEEHCSFIRKGLYTNLQIYTNKADICAWGSVCFLFTVFCGQSACWVWLWLKNTFISETEWNEE